MQAFQWVASHVTERSEPQGDPGHSGHICVQVIRVLVWELILRQTATR